MKVKGTYFVTISGLLGLLLILASACSRDKTVDAGPSVGALAPDFSLVDPSGQTVSLKDLRGKSVLINFWATWCYPCREEMDDLQAIHERYKDNGVVVLGINVREKEGVVREFINRFNITYSILLDEEGKVSDIYNVFGIPSSLFIDKNGVIRDIIMGQMNEEMIAEKVDKLINYGGSTSIG